MNEQPQVDAQRQRPMPVFRPISRQSTRPDVSKAAPKNVNNEIDRIPLKQALISTEFCPQSIKGPGDAEEANVNNDEIIGDTHGFAETGNFAHGSIFRLSDDENDDQEPKQSVLFDDPFPPRFGSCRKTKTPRWTAEETEMFYNLVSMCGTDFSMISKFFPKRTRKMISNKYHCELQKKGNSKLKDALSNPKPLDLQYLSKIVGVSLKSLYDDYEKNKDRIMNGDTSTPLPVISTDKDKISSADEIETESDEPPPEKSKPTASSKSVRIDKQQYNAGGGDEIEGTDDFSGF